MVFMDARHTGEPGFDSLLRHFFKNLTQHLALPESPAGQTVCHPPLYVHKPVVESFKNRWTIRKVDHPCWLICLVDNPQVGKTTMNRLSSSMPADWFLPHIFLTPCHIACFYHQSFFLNASRLVLTTYLSYSMSYSMFLS